MLGIGVGGEGSVEVAVGVSLAEEEGFGVADGEIDNAGLVHARSDVG